MKPYADELTQEPANYSWVGTTCAGEHKNGYPCCADCPLWATIPFDDEYCSTPACRVPAPGYAPHHEEE